MHFFFKRIFTLEKATFRKIVPWMTTVPVRLTVFWWGEWGVGVGGGCRLCEGGSLHPADRHGLGVHFHSFIFIHSFNQQTYIEHVPLSEHCARQWDREHEQNTFFDLPPFSTGCCQRRTFPCPKAVLLVGAMLPSKRHWAMSRDIFSCHDL